jgi:hypothetical protein
VPADSLPALAAEVEPHTTSLWAKALPLGAIFFCASFNLTILQSLKDALVVTAMPDVTTLHEAFRRGVRVANEGPCLGFRPVTAVALGAGGKPEMTAGPYEWQTYAQVAARVDAIGAGLLHLGLVPPNADPTPLRLTGIYSKNRLEYTLVINACYSQSMSDVPLYDIPRGGSTEELSTAPPVAQSDPFSVCYERCGDDLLRHPE